MMEVLIRPIREEVGSVTGELWDKFCQHVRREEARVMEAELIVESRVEPVIICPGESDSSDSRSSSESDTESAISDPDL